MQRKFPFEEIELGARKFLRTFLPHVDSDELIWHRDAEDRVIYVVESSGWFLQLDDQLPTVLKEGASFFIKKNSWHRVIKTQNCNRLKIVVQKL
jgi:quercetin dioxygenase-like cupin family protein